MKRLQVHGSGQLTNLESFGIKTPAATSLMAVAMETQKKKGKKFGVLKKMKADCHSVVIILVVESKVYNNSNMPECF